MTIDDLVHQPTRLRLFAYLYAHGEVSFTTLVEDLDVTKGNLSSHVQKLEDAGCVEEKKELVDDHPRTSYRLTDLGRSKFEAHVDTLEAIIGQVEE